MVNHIFSERSLRSLPIRKQLKEVMHLASPKCEAQTGTHKEKWELAVAHANIVDLIKKGKCSINQRNKPPHKQKGQ